MLGQSASMKTRTDDFSCSVSRLISPSRSRAAPLPAMTHGHGSMISILGPAPIGRKAMIHVGPSDLQVRRRQLVVTTCSSVKSAKISPPVDLADPVEGGSATTTTTRIRIPLTHTTWTGDARTAWKLQSVLLRAGVGSLEPPLRTGRSSQTPSITLFTTLRSSSGKLLQPRTGVEDRPMVRARSHRTASVGGDGQTGR